MKCDFYRIYQTGSPSRIASATSSNMSWLSSRPLMALSMRTWWRGSLKKCRSLKLGASMGSRSPWRMYTQRCTLCSLILTSEIPRKGKNFKSFSYTKFPMFSLPFPIVSLPFPIISLSFPVCSLRFPIVISPVSIISLLFLIFSLPYPIISLPFLIVIYLETSHGIRHLFLSGSRFLLIKKLQV